MHNNWIHKLVIYHIRNFIIYRLHIFDPTFLRFNPAKAQENFNIRGK